MDPLTALGFAANIVQFVQFAAGLLQSGKSIYNSVSGQSPKNESLEEIYRKLFDFGQCLQARIPPEEQQKNFPSERSENPFGDNLDPTTLLPKSIGSLTISCNRDCEKLLHIVGTLKSKNATGPKWWTSFLVAMKEVVKANEIKELQDRITRYQSQIVLEICTLSSAEVEKVGMQVRGLQMASKEIHTRRASELHNIFTSLGQIEKQVTGIKSMIGSEKVATFSADNVDSLTNKISELSLASEEFSKEYALLAELNYPQRPARHDKIQNAHWKTFQWVFHPISDDQRMKINIAQWLVTGSGVFWVSGKPGSGKSTLMKYIADHEQTQSMLSSWAGEKAMVIASHYFWYAGTSIQRSHEGLLRSLLFNICCHIPEMISEVFPERWARSRGAPRYHFDDSMSWTLTELQNAMSQIAATGSDLPAKICLFIDGLDEFNGDHAEICQTIKSLCRSPNIKACISSRPWNVFEENLGDDPAKKLYIHELTRKDIRDYVEESLSAHPRWKSLSPKKTTGVHPLIEEITNRAQGVFLWVHLVTKLLREGLTNYDSITDLWKRLEALPSDLESFFKHVLNSVEPFYHEKMAGTLLIAAAAQEPLPITIYSFHDIEYENRSYAIYETVEPWDQEIMNAFNEPLSRRLSSRCKGLLEINGDNVEFLHRTVSDFLRNREVEDFITAKTRKDFDPRLSIFQAYVAWIKHTHFLEIVNLTDSERPSFENPGLQHLVAVLDTALPYAQGLDIYSSSKLGFNSEDLLNSLGLAVEEISHSLVVNAHSQEANVNKQLEREVCVLFRRCALRSGLDRYIRRQMEQDGEYLEGFEIPPLTYVLGHGSKTADVNLDVQTWSLNRLELLHYLLAEGHDPNQVYLHTSHPKTPWLDFIERMSIPLSYDNLSSGTRPAPSHYPAWNARCRSFIESLDNGVFAVLLKLNADPNATISGMPIWARYMLSAFVVPCIDQYTDKFIHDLDKMLSRADFEAPAEGIQNIVQDSFEQEPAYEFSMASAYGIFQEQSGTSMMKLLWRVLSEPQYRKATHTYRQAQLVSKAVSAFLKYAKNSSQFPSHMIQKKLHELFPMMTPKRPRDQYEDRSEVSKRMKGMADKKIPIIQPPRYKFFQGL